MIPRIVNSPKVVRVEGVLLSKNVESTRMSFGLANIISLAYIIISEFLSGPINLEGVGIDVIVIPTVLIGVNFV